MVLCGPAPNSYVAVHFFASKIVHLAGMNP